MRKIFVLSIVVLVGILFIAASVSVSIPGKKVQDNQYPMSGVQKAPEFGKIPLYFIPNRGQDDEEAHFYAKTSRYTLWMTEEGLVFDSVHTPRDVSRLIFLNANPNPEMVPVDMTDHRVNYFM